MFNINHSIETDRSTLIDEAVYSWQFKHVDRATHILVHKSFFDGLVAKARESLPIPDDFQVGVLRVNSRLIMIGPHLKDNEIEVLTSKNQIA